jgi:hypothetical protein
MGRRGIALLLCLALCPLAPVTAAPAPLPRRNAETPAQARQRQLVECRRRLDELGVKWRVVIDRGRRSVHFSVDHPNGRGGMGGSWEVGGDDLLGTLRDILRQVEAFLRHPGRL